MKGREFSDLSNKVICWFFAGSQAPAWEPSAYLQVLHALHGKK